MLKENLSVNERINIYLTRKSYNTQSLDSFILNVLN